MSDDIFVVSVCIERFGGGDHDIVDIEDIGGEDFTSLERAEQFATELRQRAYDMHESESWKTT